MSLLNDLQSRFPALSFQGQAPLREMTTFRLGGPCPVLIDSPPADALPALLRFLHEYRTPLLVIGQGANLVVSDQGLDCVVIRFCSDMPQVETDGQTVRVSGDTLLDDLARTVVEHECGDLAFCTGIPGTVGGGIAGNAGAFGRQLGDHLLEAELLDPNGTVRVTGPEGLDFSYRHSNLKESGTIVLSARFFAPPASATALLEERKRILSFRREHHPDWHETPCAGSVFRNVEPSSAAGRRQAAGWFLEQAGAHRLQVGGARVYEKHANIIVAGTGCTAQDVYRLTHLMQQKVLDHFDLHLIPEIRFLGPF